jgi:glycosyltransferase involved in cell wall biosynthesis
MRDQATLSQAFSGIPVHVIENPIDPTFFESRDSALARKVMGIPLGHFVAITVAAQLDNPIKQVRSCIEAFNSACARLGVPGTYVLAGRGAEKFSSDFSNVLAVGSGDSKHVAKAMSAANVLISGSIAESAGMTIVEAAGQGIPSVVLSNGGSDSKILDGETGFLVKNFSEMTSCLVRMHSAVTSPGRGLRADKIKKKASIESSITHVSNQYTKIYEKLLS